jgi:hypothetical protein
MTNRAICINLNIVCEETWKDNKSRTCVRDCGDDKYTEKFLSDNLRGDLGTDMGVLLK